jgi:glycine cleavage system H lipoate-binding protein
MNLRLVAFLSIMMFTFQCIYAQNSKFIKAFNDVTADNAVTKDELSSLKSIILLDGIIDKNEQDSIYSIGLNGLNKFVTVITKSDKIDALVNAGIFERQGDLELSINILDKNKFTEKVNEIKKRKLEKEKKVMENELQYFDKDQNVMFTKDYLWICIDDSDIVTIGITQFFSKYWDGKNDYGFISEIDMTDKKNITKKDDMADIWFHEGNFMPIHSPIEGEIIKTNNIGIPLEGLSTNEQWLIKIKSKGSINIHTLDE